MKHVVRQHMRKFDCPKCDRRLNSFGEFNDHARFAHNTKGYDEYKAKYFEGSLAVAVETAPKPLNWDDWNCPVPLCKEKFTVRKDLFEHMMEKHIRREVSRRAISKTGLISELPFSTRSVPYARQSCQGWRF